MELLAQGFLLDIFSFVLVSMFYWSFSGGMFPILVLYNLWGVWWGVPIVVIYVVFSLSLGAPPSGKIRERHWFVQYLSADLLGPIVRRWFPSWETRGTLAKFDDNRVCQVFSPHGVFPTTASFAPGGVIDNPKMILTVAQGIFVLPVVREIAVLVGANTVSKKSIVTLMQKEAPMGIVLGGCYEAVLSQPGMLVHLNLQFYVDFVSTPGTQRVYVSGRRGLFYYAIKYRYRLQPVFTFGETDLFWTPSVVVRARAWLADNFSIPLLLFWGWFFCIPRRVPLMTVYGPVLEVEHNAKPTTEDVDRVRQRYVAALKDLFVAHRAEYAALRGISVESVGELEVL